MLKAMIGEWPSLGQTSTEGIRKSFLQRQGELLLTNEGWSLQVQPRSFDTLLDRLPWSCSVVLLPWMPLPLYVTWR
jgi:hypothetical protein